MVGSYKYDMEYFDGVYENDTKIRLEKVLKN
jgi:hypothetical protein